MADRRDESGGAGGGRSKRKKQRRGGAAPQRHQQPNAHSIGGGKSRRQQARQQTAGPCAAFLAALEEQRENERRRQELQQHLQADEVTEAVAQASATVPANQRDQRQSAPIAPAASAQQPAAPVAQIAGFYYDEAQKRYFKLTPQIKQQVKQMKQVHIAKEKDAVRRKALEANRGRHHQHGSAAGSLRSALRPRCANATPGGWLGYFAERERSFVWSVGRHDQRELMPRLFASMMVKFGVSTSTALRQADDLGFTYMRIAVSCLPIQPQQELRPLHVEVSESRHRITSLDLQAKGDGYGAMGCT